MKQGFFGLKIYLWISDHDSLSPNKLSNSDEARDNHTTEQDDKHTTNIGQTELIATVTLGLKVEKVIYTVTKHSKQIP